MDLGTPWKLITKVARKMMFSNKILKEEEFGIKIIDSFLQRFEASTQVTLGILMKLSVKQIETMALLPHCYCLRQLTFPGDGGK